MFVKNKKGCKFEKPLMLVCWREIF